MTGCSHTITRPTAPRRPVDRPCWRGAFARTCAISSGQGRHNMPLGVGSPFASHGTHERLVALKATYKDVETLAIDQDVSGEDPSEFFEPFLRSFILGASAGAAFEVFHVIFKFWDTVREVGTGELSQVLPSLSDRFSPVFVNDHVVAVACWLLFYGIEAYAVIKVLDKHSQDPTAARRALKTLVTLPRILLPRVKVFKALFRLLGVGKASATPAFSLPRSVPYQGLVAPTAPPARPHIMPPVPDIGQEPEGPPENEPPEEEPLQRVLPPSTSPKSQQETRRQQGLRPGQLDLNTTEFFRRQKELQSRKCYLQNFWYAAGFSEQIKDKPVGVELLGEKVVLFRSAEGVVQCLRDVCPHRGAPLSLGWKSEVNGHDCIVCPYHGWAFDGEGRLRDVPAAENSHDWPQKPIVNAFPVEEKGGFVWLFYGSKSLPKDERPPIPYVPELNDPAWRPVYGEIEFDCNHWSVFENAIDMAHIHYLHSDSFGNESQPQIRDMTCTTNAYGVEASFALHNKPVNALWEFSKVPEVKVSAKAHLPSTSVIGFKLGQGLSFITFVNTVPISANRTVNRFALIRRLDVDKIGSYVFNLKAWDSAARRAMIKILTQDKHMVEKLAPEMLGREISVKADLPQMAYRKLRQQYIDMGYGVSPEASMVLPRNARPDM